MTMLETTATALVTDWSDGAATSWTTAEVTSTVVRVQALSEVVTPRIVADIAIDPADEQRYLRRRLERAISDWLARPAAEARRSIGVSAPHVSPDGAPLLGLYSATLAELEALRGVGDARALDIARLLARHPGVGALDNLQAIQGIGPATVEGLRGKTYFDRPRLSLVSPSVVAFAANSTASSFIALLEAGDLEVSLGDGTALTRRGFVGGTVVARFLAMLDGLIDHHERSVSPESIPLASGARAWLDRHDKLEAATTAAAAAGPASGRIIVNDDYVAAVRPVIQASATTIRLMVFLGTTTAGDDLEPGPLQLIEALEERASARVDVRVILDQDEGGEPYGSLFINQALLDRLEPTAVKVKFDTEHVLLHSKVMIVDDQVAVVGSHNWTKAGLNDTYELSVLMDSPALAAAFASRFDVLWNALP